MVDIDKIRKLEKDLDKMLEKEGDQNTIFSSKLRHHKE